MATELTSVTLNPDQHLLLDQPLLRLPFELNRKNCRTARWHVEKERDNALQMLKSAASATSAAISKDESATAAVAAAATQGNTDSSLITTANESSETTTDNDALATTSTTNAATACLDTLIQRMHGLKRKLESLHEEEKVLHVASRRRIEHLQSLYEIQSLADVKYEMWSKVRLSRLLVDYLLRGGYNESAKALARAKGIEEMVDVDAFVQCHRVESSLKRGRTQEGLAWCNENKQALRKMNSILEFELRLQQYIELIRSGETQKVAEAALHARKYLSGHQDTDYAVRAAGLLAHLPDTCAQPYQLYYSQDRWQYLASLFVQTHHDLFSLPPRPLLHLALSAGLTALKTPSCHSQFTSSSSNATSSATSVCPICSTELNELARAVPYAQHAKSYVEADPVVLPNGRIYGRERLIAANEKLGTVPGKVRDPTERDQLFDESEIQKVFIM